MRKIFFFTFMALITFIVRAQENYEKMDLLSFSQQNPKNLSYDVIYDGCTLKLCSDGELLFIQFEIMHPEMQMRFLMQGLSIYIDPTGKKKDKYCVLFSSANDLQDQLSLRPEPQNRQKGYGTQNQRPDISPIIYALSTSGAIFDINGKKESIEPSQYAIDIVGDSDKLLSYSVIIPIERLLKEKKLNKVWTIGLYSEGGQPQEGGPGSAQMPFNPGMNQMPQPPQKDSGKSDIRKIMANDIQCWQKFEFQESCSVN